MIDYRKATFSKTNRAYDDGLRKYFLRIYQLMCGALVVTAISAFAVFCIPYEKFLSNNICICPKVSLGVEPAFNRTFG